MEAVIEAKDILERMKQGIGAKSDTDLGRKLGLAQQSVYNAKNKGRIPDAWVRKAADEYNLSLDWLCYGIGAMHRGKTTPGQVCNPVIEKNILLDVLEIVEECLKTAQKMLSPGAKAELICQLYHLLLEEEPFKQQQIKMFRLIQNALTENE